MTQIIDEGTGHELPSPANIARDLVDGRRVQYTYLGDGIRRLVCCGIIANLASSHRVSECIYSRLVESEEPYDEKLVHEFGVWLASDR